MRLVLLSAAAAGMAAEDAAYDRSVRPFLNEYCVQCHGAKSAMADRRFDSLSADLSSPETQRRWKEIVDRLNLGAMPPAGAKQPTDERRREVIDAVTARLTRAFAESRSTGARTVLRRLNRFEYDRTVRHLLSLEGMLADPTDVFPPDAVDDGFTNIGSALSTSDFLLTGYLSAAENFIDRAAVSGPKPEIRKYSFKAPFHPTGNRHDGQDAPGQYQNIRKNTTDEGGFLWLSEFEKGVPQDGYYKLRFKAAGVNRNYPYDQSILEVEKSEPLRVAVVAGSAAYGQLGSRTTSDRELISFELPDDTPKWFEARIWLDRGYQPRLTYPNGPSRVKPLRKPLTVQYFDQFPRFIREYVVEEGPVNEKTVNESLTRRVSKQGASKTELTTEGTSRSFNRREGWASFFREYMGPRVRVYEIELEGPHFDQWPPPSHVALFGGYEPSLSNAEPILRRFASRAFRRPASDAEIAPLVKMVKLRAAKGDPPLAAIKAGLRGVLCSPGFLYLRENDGPLDDYALASRLSYFLWSSMPDDALLQAAGAGKLRQPEALRAQARRMLGDPKSEAFAGQFISRWLELYKLGSMPPSPREFQQYYVDGLEKSMKTEAQMFFRYLLENNLPLDRFLDADFTFVNGGLARLYDIPNIHGAQFQKVSLTDRRRGGLLGMGGVLTASANGIDTSPVVRGVWVMKNILGTPPIPPPPDVKPLEPDIRGAITIRDQLAKHRTIATCNSCHQKIDPPGFALENFDAIGGWRQNYERPGKVSPPIDASGELAAGEQFKDVVSFKDVLLRNHRGQFARCLTEKLLAYAMGRKLEPADGPQVDRIVRTLDQEKGGLRDLVLLIAGSEPFRTK
ncbi:MAG TPA: DUF1592 domain-containing protein [Bryobacteraceae bacterium]|jgi:hypothetical protein|nr:DUF1592 domain-containing protein [Bryobacteraceae bacterium]